MAFSSDVPSWDDYFMSIVDAISKRSKDRSTKVGCVLVSADNGLLSTGYNSFPRGINDHKPERHERPEKYLWTEHAERNAIFAAARHGTPLEGCRAYVPFSPCMDCARALVQVGCVEVVAKKLDPEDPLYKRWMTDFTRVGSLFEEANVKFRFVGGVKGPT